MDNLEAYLQTKRAFDLADKELKNYKEAFEIAMTFIRSNRDEKIYGWEVKQLEERIEKLIKP